MKAKGQPETPDKRALFAAMAMQGYCGGKLGMMDYKKVAESAVKQADALIEELNKKQIHEGENNKGYGY